MGIQENLAEFSREELVALMEIYSKNWLALDGLWFQSIEGELGMDAAMRHDENAWRSYTQIEARRIKAFLGLEDRPGLEGLARALRLRMYANLNEDAIELRGNELIYSVKTCRVQAARQRKGMPWHPCKRVGLVEYAGFAQAIDDRIACACESCYPEIMDGDACCRWRFWIEAQP